jgi:hypothetical protein
MSRLRLGVVLLVVAIAAVTVALSASATTGVPGTFVTANVRLGDKTLYISRHSSSGVQVIGFRIRNVGKKTHNFIIGDHATNPIKPGQFDDFAVAFDDFGPYVYKCTLNCLPSQRGIINVKRGSYVDVG